MHSAAIKIELNEQEIPLRIAPAQAEKNLSFRALGSFEKINLFLPLLFLFATVIVIFSGYKIPGKEYFAISAMSNFLFFNTTHVFFTLISVSALPEFRQLVRMTWKKKKSWIYLTIGFSLYLPIIYFFNTLSVFDKMTKAALFMIPNILFYRHSMKQSFGISQLYNQQAKKILTAEEIKALLPLEKEEKKIFKFLIGLNVIYLVSTNYEILSNLVNYRLLFFTMGLLLIPLARLLYRLKGRIWLYKKIYLSRMLFYVITPYAPFANAGAAAMHGLEYFLLSIQMIKKSKVIQKNILISLISAAAVLLTGVLFSYKFPNYFSNEGYSGFWSLFYSKAWFTLFFTVEYLHYFLDSLIFRMRDPVVRETIGPLLDGD